MWRLILVLVTAGLVLVAAGIGVAEPVNESAVTAGGLYWSTAKEEGDLSPGIDIGDSDGGFSSLDGMLQWAIGLDYLLLLSFISVALPALSELKILISFCYTASTVFYSFCDKS